jgi:invasion protein IalB
VGKGAANATWSINKEGVISVLPALCTIYASASCLLGTMHVVLVGIQSASGASSILHANGAQVQEAAEDVDASDQLRLEHLWLLLAAETVKEISCCVPPAGVESMRERLVHIIHFQLQELMGNYMERMASEENQSIAVSSNLMLEDGTQLMVDRKTGAHRRISLWEEDRCVVEVRDLKLPLSFRASFCCHTVWRMQIVFVSRYAA